MRIDGRKFDQLRSVKITPHVSRYAEGSVTIEMGETKVLCTASVEQNIPKWLQGSQKGWVSAEYGMLPRSTHDRIQREKAANSGRTQEISRLIGRSLRASIDMYKLGEKQIVVDCDVLQADGGTRCASVTGGMVALALALETLKSRGTLREDPLKFLVSAISVGLSPDGPLLDLNYIEDSQIHTDMNFVFNEANQFIEIQGTAEAAPFDHSQLNKLIEVAQKGCQELFLAQKECLKFCGLPT